MATGEPEDAAASFEPPRPRLVRVACRVRSKPVGPYWLIATDAWAPCDADVWALAPPAPVMPPWAAAAD